MALGNYGRTCSKWLEGKNALLFDGTTVSELKRKQPKTCSKRPPKPPTIVSLTPAACPAVHPRPSLRDNVLSQVSKQSPLLFSVCHAYVPAALHGHVLGLSVLRVRPCC